MAALPTVTVLGVFLLVEVFTRQTFLFASLASSAFLIYKEPENGMWLLPWTRIAICYRGWAVRLPTR